jgi:hypothetical protein
LQKRRNDMERLAAVAMLLVLGCAGEAQREDCGPTFSTTSETDALARRVLGRWSDALGCELPVTETGAPIYETDYIEPSRVAPAGFHVVRAKGQTRVDWTGGVYHGPLWTALLRRPEDPAAEERTLTHEVAHALGLKAHLPTGVGSDDTSEGRIDAALLEVVCKLQPCRDPQGEI